MKKLFWLGTMLWLAACALSTEPIAARPSFLVDCNESPDDPACSGSSSPVEYREPGSISVIIIWCPQDPRCP